MIQTLINNVMSKQDGNRQAIETLNMDRICLSQDYPTATFGHDRAELCIYVLLGDIAVHVEWGWGVCEENMAALPLSVPRRTVQEPMVCILRMPAFTAGPKITINLGSYSADVLCVWNSSPEAKDASNIPPSQRYAIQTTCYNHHVGTGTHERWVREVPTPPGYTIHCGETLNIPGGWSSWPSHATPEEVARHAEHEELFFVITPGYGLMHCDGLYPDGTRAPQVQRVANGDAIRTPLGAHEIVFSPGDWGWYFWAYRSFLQKQYNKWATDGVKTYVK